MKIVAGTLSLVGLVLGIATAVILGINGWQIYRDIDSWKDRSEVSSEPHDMLEYMSRARDGMVRWGMTSGNAALIFQSSETDMELVFRNVNQYVEQATLLTKMDPTSTQYSMNLEQLSWSINRINLHTFQFWVNHEGLAYQIFCWVGWIMCIVFAIWWAVEY